VIVNGSNAGDWPVVTKVGTSNENAKLSIGPVLGVKLKLYNKSARAEAANTDRRNTAKKVCLRMALLSFAVSLPFVDGARGSLTVRDKSFSRRACYRQKHD